MEIVKLADRGEAALQHVRVRPRRERLDVVDGDARGIAVHLRPPRPKRIVVVRWETAQLDASTQRALKRVAVRVHETGKLESVAGAGNVAVVVDDRALHASAARPRIFATIF